MKDAKPDSELESSPCRERVVERPDNGTKTGRDLGPSSEVHKDNPHKQLSHARHPSLPA